MYYDDQVRFERFTFLAPPKFSGSIRDDTYEFLHDYKKRLHNIKSLESHGVSYINYQLIYMDIQWWKYLTSCRPLGSLVMKFT